MSLNPTGFVPEHTVSTTPADRSGRLEPRHLRVVGWTMVVMLWGASAINYSTASPVARNGHVKGGDYAHFYIMARFAAQRQGVALYERRRTENGVRAGTPGRGDSELPAVPVRPAGGAPPRAVRRAAVPFPA